MSLLGFATMSQSHDMMTAMNMPPLVFLLNGWVGVCFSLSIG